MAPMAPANPQDVVSLRVFEDHLIRCIVLFFTRAAHGASKEMYERSFRIIHWRITRSKTNWQRYKYLSDLAGLIRRFLLASRLDVMQNSISRLPGCREFCQFFQYYPWLRQQWEPIILSCTFESWSTWVEKRTRRPELTVLKLATEEWEWSCFRHYRASFVHWALDKIPCNECFGRLSQMVRNVEYDNIDVAMGCYNPATPFLDCIPGPFTRWRHDIASLKPFIMILRQPKNARWLAWWAPLIQMHTGSNVLELYHAYIQNGRELSRRLDEISGTVSAPQYIVNMMFQHRDLELIVDDIVRENVLVTAWIGNFGRRRNIANEAARNFQRANPS